MISDMDATFFGIFNLCDVHMRIAMTFVIPRGYLRGPPLKRSQFLGVVFIRGKSLEYFYINQDTKGYFSILNHHKCVGQLFPLYLNTCVMGLRPL